jgi:hypothetical protein
MSSNTPFLANLDTTFVNLWSLLRKLTEQDFIGRVHIELKDYIADIFLDGSHTPIIREFDRAANTEVIEQGALHRVVLRVRESPGTINVFAGANEATVPQPTVTWAGSVDPEPVVIAEPKLTEEPVPEEPKPEAADAVAAEAHVPQFEEAVYRTGSYDDWPAILTVTGEIIGAIERGLSATGGDFLNQFNAVRLELADDYTFLDPMPQTFQYQNGSASLKSQPSVNVFVSGLTEALRRTIDRIAVGDRARRVRERIAVELLPVARKRADVLERSGLGLQLDRIAGTKVL